MPNLRYELHCRICNLRYGTHGYGMSAYWVMNRTTQSANLRYVTHGYGRSAYWITTEINLYSHHNLSSTSLNEF